MRSLLLLLSCAAPAAADVVVVDPVGLYPTLRADGAGADQSTQPTSVGAGLVVRDAQASLYRCLAFGGDGASTTQGDGGAAGRGIHVAGPSGALYTFRGFVAGGAGGDTSDVLGACATGGAGLHVESSALAWRQEVNVIGGPGGAGGGGYAPGADIVGNVSSLPGPTRAFFPPRVVREAESFTIEIRGQAGDVVWLHHSHATDWNFTPARYGAWLLVGPSWSTVAPAGVVPGNGQLFIQATQPAVVDALGASVTWMQMLLRDAQGTLRVGKPTALVALDAAF